MTEPATRAGLTPEELEDIAVPTFDLEEGGRLQRNVGAFVAEIRITGSDDVALAWLTSNAARQKSVPAAVRDGHAAELNQLKKTAKDIVQILPAQKARLERLLESDRLIPFEKWRERYVEHPMVGQMSQRLIWQFSQGERSELGVFGDGHILDVNGRTPSLKLGVVVDWRSPVASAGFPSGARPRLASFA